LFGTAGVFEAAAIFGAAFPAGNRFAAALSDAATFFAPAVVAAFAFLRLATGGAVDLSLVGIVCPLPALAMASPRDTFRLQTVSTR
jgi:hypothetical protein